MEEKQNLLPAGVLDMQGAADYLGVSPITIYRLTSRRLIPHFKMLGRLRFKEEDLRAFMFRNRVATTDELDEQAAEIGRTSR